MPSPPSADIRCSTVLIFTSPLTSVDARRASPTSWARAGRSTGEARSTRRNMMPLSTAPGRITMRTFWPVCNPTPEARMSDFRVRWRSMGSAIVAEALPMRLLRDSSALFSFLQQGLVALFELLGAALGVHLVGKVVDDPEPGRAAVEIQ